MAERARENAKPAGRMHRGGGGRFAASRTCGGGTPLVKAIDKIVANAKKIAAHLLEAAGADIEFADGKFSAGQVMRVMFTAQDSQTIRDAFGRAKPNSEYARLYAAAVARRQADQIYNLSLTRTADAARGFEGALSVRVEDKRQGPPKLHDLPSLQKLCGSRFGWPASKTLEVAQELYDGHGKKIITYPRAEVRYLPQSLISDVPRIVAGLRVGQSFSAIPVPAPPVIRKGASGTFYDKGLEGASHHAVIPNVNTIDKLREVWPRLSSDEKKLFDVIARAYLAALMPDFRYRDPQRSTCVVSNSALPVVSHDLGWRAAFPTGTADEKGDEAQLLPQLRNGETAQLHDPKIEDKETRPTAALQRRHSDRGDAKCLALC